MAFDFRKEYKAFYLPPDEPHLITVPAIPYIAVRGQGDPNQQDGEYQEALSLLYGIAYTIKMSKTGSHQPDGYHDFVVPPLEGFWWQDGTMGVDFTRKQDFHWISVIRLPDFAGPDVVAWAKQEAARKKGMDFSKVAFLTVEEGLCVQCMHHGPFDAEPATVARMHAFLEEQGCAPDFSDTRRHHEIYLSDVRKVPPEQRRTVIRHPVRRV